MSDIGWPTYTYGITTVPSRRHTTLPRTLSSLNLGGFNLPRLFVDLVDDKLADYSTLNLPVTFRSPALGLHGNWILSLYELYLREPLVDRYCIFQDDIITYRNLRQYLNRCKLKNDQIWNLYTFPPGYQTSPPDPEPADTILTTPGTAWCGPEGSGWYPSNQFGRSALALIFPREVVKRILAHPHIIQKAEDTHRRNTIDGAISEVIRNLGIVEYVHDPSLVQHVGQESTVAHPRYPVCNTFRGEDYDARELLT